MGKTWFIPHHGVYHPRKPGKIRVVFDCSAKNKGKSLNDLLLKGPDLTNSLLGVLTRFRQEHVAVMVEIGAMYHQVKVPDTDCSFSPLSVVAEWQFVLCTERIPDVSSLVWCRNFSSLCYFCTPKDGG